MNDNATVTIKYIRNIDSTNMKPTREDMAIAISENYDDYDGFVITHGTDTMAYTASALSFVLGNLGKPVCVTGAQIPVSDIGSDARNNYSCVASMDKAAVMVVFGTEIILGARPMKVSKSQLNAFGSRNMEPVGEIGIRIDTSSKAKDRHNEPLDLRVGFQQNVTLEKTVPRLRCRDGNTRGNRR